MRRAFALIALIVALLGPAALGAAQEATPVTRDTLLAEQGFPELTITTDGTDFDIPAEIEAGRYRVVLENSSELSADLEFLQLPEGVTMDDLTAVFEGAGPEAAVPDWFFQTVSNGGPVTAAGETDDVILDLTPGEWVAHLYTYEAEGGGPGAMGASLPKMITVTGEMPPLSEPPAAVTIELVEMAFVMPDTISAGPQIWKVITTGEQPHHMIVAQVPDGTTEEDVLNLITAMFGGPPAASPVADASPVAPGLAFEDATDVFETLVLTTGQANWVDLDLAPGTYVAICILPDAETGVPHVMLGMIKIFTAE